MANKKLALLDEEIRRIQNLIDNYKNLRSRIISIQKPTEDYNHVIGALSRYKMRLDDARKNLDHEEHSANEIIKEAAKQCINEPSIKKFRLERTIKSSPLIEINTLKHSENALDKKSLDHHLRERYLLNLLKSEPLKNFATKIANNLLYKLPDEINDDYKKVRSSIEISEYWYPNKNLDDKSREALDDLEWYFLIQDKITISTDSNNQNTITIDAKTFNKRAIIKVTEYLVQNDIPIHTLKFINADNTAIPGYGFNKRFSDNRFTIKEIQVNSTVYNKDKILNDEPKRRNDTLTISGWDEYREQIKNKIKTLQEREPLNADLNTLRKLDTKLYDLEQKWKRLEITDTQLQADLKVAKRTSLNSVLDPVHKNMINQFSSQQLSEIKKIMSTPCYYSKDTQSLRVDASELKRVELGDLIVDIAKNKLPIKELHIDGYYLAYYHPNSFKQDFKKYSSDCPLITATKHNMLQLINVKEENQESVKKLINDKKIDTIELEVDLKNSTVLSKLLKELPDHIKEIKLTGVGAQDLTSTKLKEICKEIPKGIEWTLEPGEALKKQSETITNEFKNKLKNIKDGDVPVTNLDDDHSTTYFPNS